jgi:hypothetical protein
MNKKQNFSTLWTVQTKYLCESNLKFNQAWKIMDLLRTEFKIGRVKSALFIAQ